MNVQSINFAPSWKISSRCWAVLMLCVAGCASGDVDPAGSGGSAGSSGGAGAMSSSGGSGGRGGASSAAGGSAGVGGTAGSPRADSGPPLAVTDASTANGAGGARPEGGAAADRGNVGTIRGDAAAAVRDAFPQCRFHFGTLEEIARNNAALLSEIDFFTPGWMGQNDQFDMGGVCENTKPGATFGRQVPVIVSYLAAFYAKRHMNLKDCNAPGAGQSLCQAGAQYIQQNLPAILTSYESYAQGFASCYGTTKPIIFLMEPDFYQYTDSMQGMPWSQAQSGQIMGQLVAAMKKHLPNAIFSLDISPWVGPNGGDNGQGWFSNFDMSQFTFISTSGGGTEANNMFIRSANRMTWAGVTQVTGKPMMADTGYGVNGMPAGPDAAWDTVSNINSRIDDGVVSISQYSPSSSWASTIAGMRSQLKAPRGCQ